MIVWFSWREEYCGGLGWCCGSECLPALYLSPDDMVDMLGKAGCQGRRLGLQQQESGASFSRSSATRSLMHNKDWASDGRFSCNSHRYQRNEFGLSWFFGRFRKAFTLFHAGLGFVHFGRVVSHGWQRKDQPTFAKVACSWTCVWTPLRWLLNGFTVA